MKKTDFLIILGLILVLLVGFFLIKYYLLSLTNECLANPLVYGAKQYELREGVKTFGTLSFYNHPEVRIIFDSYNLSIQQDNSFFKFQIN